MPPPADGFTHEELKRLYNNLLVEYYRVFDEREAIIEQLHNDGMSYGDICAVMAEHVARVRRDFFPFSGMGSRH